MCKNVVIFGVGNSSSLHNDNNKKDILVLVEGPTQKLDNSKIISEAKYLINFSRTHEKFCLSHHYNGSNSYLFVNATKMYQFKAKDFEIKPYPLCLGIFQRILLPIT